MKTALCVRANSLSCWSKHLIGLGLAVAVIAFSSLSISAQAPDEIAVTPPPGARRAPKSIAKNVPTVVMRSVVVPKAILNEILQDVRGYDKAELTRSLSAKSVDLNSDGKPEILVFGEHSYWCGAGANCTSWVYRKVGNSYDLLLEEKNIEVQTSFENRYRNLVATEPSGALQMYITLYKFDGQAYKMTECYERTYSQGGGRRFKTKRLNCSDF